MEARDLVALELASSLRGRRDELASASTFAAWLEHNRASLGAVEPGIALRVAEFRALRRAVHALFEASAADRPLPAEAVRQVNEASAAAPTHLHLDAAGTPRARSVGAGGSRAAGVLAAIARSAILIVAGDDRARLRRCPGCGSFFLSSRRGRIWCSDGCGNRVRVARHHARRRAR